MTADPVDEEVGRLLDELARIDAPAGADLLVRIISLVADTLAADYTADGAAARHLPAVVGTLQALVEDPRTGVAELVEQVLTQVAAAATNPG